jgi:hypothetical protein
MLFHFIDLLNKKEDIMKGFSETNMLFSQNVNARLNLVFSRFYELSPVFQNPFIISSFYRIKKKSSYIFILRVFL